MSMTNKRVQRSCQVKMLKTVKPFQVSPAIKTARWALLIYGIFYGSWKLKRLRVIEETEHVIRENKLREEHEIFMRESKRKTVGELKDLADQFEITEFPPGWENEI